MNPIQIIWVALVAVVVLAVVGILIWFFAGHWFPTAFGQVMVV
jgi:hypothetical protein